MDVGAAGFFEKAGEKDLVLGEFGPADRADPKPAAVDAIHAA
jgi:hypothetical protein